MKRYTVTYKHLVEIFEEVEVLAENREEALQKVKDGDFEDVRIMNEQGIEISDYKVFENDSES